MPGSQARCSTAERPLPLSPVFGADLIPDVGSSGLKRRIKKKVLARSIVAPHPIGTPELKGVRQSPNAYPKRFEVETSELESELNRVPQESVDSGQHGEQDGSPSKVLRGHYDAVRRARHIAPPAHSGSHSGENVFIRHSQSMENSCLRHRYAMPAPLPCADAQVRILVVEKKRGVPTTNLFVYGAVDHHRTCAKHCRQL